MSVTLLLTIILLCISVLFNIILTIMCYNHINLEYKLYERDIEIVSLKAKLLKTDIKKVKSMIDEHVSEYNNK